MTDEPDVEPPRRSNQLYVFHRILISAAIMLGVIMVVWGGLMYSTSGAWQHAAAAVFGLVAAVGLFFYLRWFLANKR